jgi:hypothetical protein
MAINGNIDLFSYLPGIEVNADELLNAELLTYQILTAKFPDLDLREGTAVRDMVIRPSATLLAMVNKALIFYFVQNSLDGVNDATPQVFVDKLMSNWFLTRKQGNKAIINVRLFFAKSKSIGIPSDVYFSTDNALKFYPTSSVSYSSTQLTYDSSSNTYYIDLDLVADKAGVNYNITNGSLIYFSNFDPFFLHAEINYLKQTAEDVESNTNFIARTKSAISTRNLINSPSITSKLLEDFSLIHQVTTFGFGDTEMKRDQIKILVPGVADPIWIHNGGKVDIFCRVALASAIIQLQTDSTGAISLGGSIYKFARSTVSGGVAADTVALYTYKTPTLTQSGGLATATSASHGYTTGDTIIISGATQTGYNGSQVINVLNANSYTFPVAVGTVSPATGTISAAKALPYTVTDTSAVSSVVTIAQTGGVATVTSANHGLTVGERVTISGANQAGYNLTALITGVPTKDTFTYAVASGTVSPATGTINMKYIARQLELGFSDRQNLTINFGATYANQTASFIVYFHQDIDGIQAYLDSPDRRVVCADLLARGHNLTELDVVITGYNAVAPSSTLATTTIKTYLAALNPGQPFIMADLLSSLYAAGITTIKTPLDITFTKYWNDNLGTTTGTITDFLNPNDTKNIFVLGNVTTTSTNI